MNDAKLDKMKRLMWGHGVVLLTATVAAFVFMPWAMACLVALAGVAGIGFGGNAEAVIARAKLRCA